MEDEEGLESAVTIFLNEACCRGIAVDDMTDDEDCFCFERTDEMFPSRISSLCYENSELSMNVDVAVGRRFCWVIGSNTLSLVFG